MTKCSSRFYFYVVIMVSPVMTSLTVQESEQMALVGIQTFRFPEQPITVTYTTTDGTATGIDCM